MSARTAAIASALGASLAVAAANSGAAATFHLDPARSARLTAVTTTPHQIGAAPDLGANQLIAYAPQDGYTYVAWDAPGAGNAGIDLCILLPNTNSCEGGGPVLLTDTGVFSGNNATDQPTLSNLNVLANGDVVVTGSSAAGSTNTAATTEAWESPEGGAAFLASGQGLTNSGGNISPVYTYYTENDSAPLSGNDLAIADAYFGYFSDSPVSGSETPSSIASPNLNTGPNGTYSRKSLEVTGDELAAEPDPAAGSGQYVVVTAGDDFSGTAPSNCPSPSLATGYGVAIGTVGGSGAGSLNAQTSQKAYSLLQCQAESPALASPVGGSQGIGVLEEEGAAAAYPSSSSQLAVVWRPFTLSATGSGSFGSPVTLQDITNHNLAGGLAFDATEDTSDGVYASWVDEQGLVLDYSDNGGEPYSSGIKKGESSWYGPSVQAPPAPGATQGDPVIAAIGNGIGEVAYTYNSQVYIETVSFEPPIQVAPTAPANANGVSVTVTCASACTVTVTLDTGAVTVARAGRKGATVHKLGTGSLKLKKAGKGALHVKLTAYGAKLLKKDHYKLSTALLLSGRAGSTTYKTTSSLRLR